MNPEDADATKMVIRMDALFVIDEEARKKGMTVDDRGGLRRQESVAWVEEIHTTCLELAGRVLPASALGQAVNYVLNLWSKLRRILDYPEVELSTNLAENSFRPVAVGRNYAQSMIMRSPPLAPAT